MGGKLCDVDIELNGLFCVVDCPKSKLVAAGALWPKELRSEPNGLAKPGVDFDGEEDLDDGRPFRGLILGKQSVSRAFGHLCHLYLRSLC